MSGRKIFLPTIFLYIYLISIMFICIVPMFCFFGYKFNIFFTTFAAYYQH